MACPYCTKQNYSSSIRVGATLLFAVGEGGRGAKHENNCKCVIKAK